MKRIIYLLLLVLIGTSACDDYLDVVPKGKVIPKKTNDYRLLLNQTEYNGGALGLVDSYNADVFLTDDMKVTPFTEPMYKEDEKNLMSLAEHIFDDGADDDNWQYLYNQVYVANVVIAEVLNSDGGSEAEKNELYAEAKVHRAFAYWALVNLYGKHYDTNSAGTDLGVPLRLGIDFEEDLSRATVQEVYDQILEDLTSVIEYLPDTQKMNFSYRPAKASAYGLLARVYLYMQQYDKAEKNAGLSLQLANELLDYNTVGSPFVFPISLENPEVLLWKQNNAPGFNYISDNLLALYNPADDLRVQLGGVPDAMLNPQLNFGFFSSKWFFGKYPVMGFTTPEAYLIRAEANARLNNNVDLILADLNEVRKYRYRSGTDYELMDTGANILTVVKEERRRELCFQGQRLFDIKRYNQFDGDNISVSKTFDGETHTMEAGNPRFILPIARKYIDLNPEIKQNPR
jgi:tetratricopeptide (TPR) repeat protein